jgi:predicted methyltransferase
MRAFILAALAAVLLAPGMTSAVAVPSPIATAIADPSRPKADREADARRKPVETLAFSGVKAGDTVGEFLPGGGYYTRLLSDVVGPKGTVYALETTRWGQQNVDSTKAVLSEPGRGNVRFDASAFGEFNLPEKVDLFWTTLNYHDLHIAKYGSVDMAAFNKHVYDSLKPGGIYFITDHFKLVGESTALANPADDHTKTVFDKAIQGHTDQMMLKFKKP